jgi:acetylornithine deacetylase
MARLELTGRSAHAATRWRGEDVLPRFEAIREAFMELETERGEAVDHPLYGEFPVPWPVVCGTVEAGSWASTVPAALTAEFRIGVAPGETVAEVEETFRARLAEVTDDDPWLREHPPTFERFSVQFEPAEVAVDEPRPRGLDDRLVDAGLPNPEPTGATYGADSRHYVAAGIPTVLLGPGTVTEAHYPDETIEWREVEAARDAIAAAVGRFAEGYAERSAAK